MYQNLGQGPSAYWIPGASTERATLSDYHTARSTFLMPPSPRPMAGCCASCDHGGPCASEALGILGIDTGSLFNLALLGGAAYLVWTKLLSPSQRRRVIARPPRRRR